MPRTLVGEAVYGNAADFNGTTQYLGRSSISSATDNITISAWINPDEITASAQHIFQNGANNANGYILMVRDSGAGGSKLRVDLSFVAGLDSTDPISAGVWTHVVAIRNAGTWQLYINGSANGGTISNSPNSPGSNTTIGCSRNSGGTGSSFFGGLIDDVRFYTRALTATEVSTLYSQGSNPEIFVGPTSLRAHWKLDETSGDAADSSGNSLTLTNFNTTAYAEGVVTISNVPARTTAGTRTVAGTRTLA